ncbi:hypothetical protein ACFL4V_00400 [Candidatus Latescibacterota bacterium]
MNDIEILQKNWIKIAIFIGTVVVITIGLGLINSLRSTEMDRKDYTVVGETFIKESGFIANKLGKVNRISHIGKGGASGRESYNVYRLRGVDNTGVCNLILTRDIEDNWFVTSADLLTDGKTLSVPIKRSEGEKWERFKIK